MVSMDEIRKMADAKQAARDEARKAEAANYPAFIRMDDVKKGEEFLFKLVARRDNTITQDAAEKAKKPFLYDVIDPMGETRTLPTHPAITSGMEDEEDEIYEGNYFYMRFDGKEPVKNQKAKPGQKFNKWTISKLDTAVGEELFKKAAGKAKKAKEVVGEE